MSGLVLCKTMCCISYFVAFMLFLVEVHFAAALF